MRCRSTCSPSLATSSTPRRGWGRSTSGAAPRSPRCSAAAGKQRRARGERTELVRAAEAAKAASAEQPEHGGRLLEYVVAKLRVLEGSWSQRSAERLLGDVRRVARLDPKLAKAARKREAQLRALIEAHTRS